MHRWEKLVSLAALSVVLGGAVYAYGRESLRNSLNARFNRINAVYFNGELSDVRLRWEYLPDDYGQSEDGEIIIDTASVTTAEQLENTLRHEACHQFTGV